MAQKRRNKGKFIVGAVLGVAYVAMRFVARQQAELGDIDIDNPYLARQGKTCKETVGADGDAICLKGSWQDDCGAPVRKDNSARRERIYSSGMSGMYVQAVKPALDRILSFGGLVFLAPIFAAIGIAIYLDDPGPVLFTQKRIGKGRHFFELHKFRSMKISTPHDVPTHQLRNPEQYITKVGAFLRKTSLDELPQIWDIFKGDMSVIGPRPALWNQEDLVAERDKYGANDVRPGLTGWAQINGRDELEIPEKAKLDGEYAFKLTKGGLEAFVFDCRCLGETIFSVLKGDGVVEGGTGVKRIDPIDSNNGNVLYTENED